MPFTFSHPAAVLPLKRLCPRFLDFSALVIGSMAPDFCYFLFLFREASFAHTLFGSVVLDIPLGLLALYLFSFSLGSQMKKSTKSGQKEPRFKQGKTLVSLWLGTMSHILWDSFTHQRGIFGEIPGISLRKIEFLGTSIYFYKILQHASSVVGMAFLFIVYHSWFGRQYRSFRAHRPPKMWLFLGLAVSMLIATLRIKDIRTAEVAIFYFTIYYVDALTLLAVFWFFHRRFKYGAYLNS